MKHLKAFALAWNMLTLIPLFQIHTFEKGINGRSAMFYPLVGMLLGALLYLLSLGLEGRTSHEHLAIVLFALSVMLSGALHLDGLSDTVDGLFVPKEDALHVMKESHVGGMGMIFTVVFLILKASSFVALENFALLVCVMMFSRLNATLAIYLNPYISSGVGSLIKEELSALHVMASVAFVFVFASTCNALGALLFTFFALLAISRFFVARYGGLSGDIYGFVIELSELLLLNYFIFAT